MNHITIIPKFQRRKSIPKQLKDLELLPLNNQFSKLTMSMVGGDELRPIMQGNFFDVQNKKIVSSDSYKLSAINMPQKTLIYLKQKYSEELKKEPRGLIFHTITQLHRDYNNLMKKNNISISLDEFVQTREIKDAKYPNYEQVIPKEFTNIINVDYQKLYWYAKVLLDGKVIDDKNKIITKNEYEYQNKKIEYLKDSYVSFINKSNPLIILTYLSDDGTIQYIGYNADFLCNILKFAMEFNGKYFGKVGIIGNRHPMIIELDNGLDFPKDNIALVMPIKINNDEYTIGQVDFDFNVKMYYDLDTNSINSDGETYPIDESIGYVAFKDSLSNLIIRVEEKISKVGNNSADFITNRIKGLRIALKVAKAENKPRIEKRIKGLEIAKKIQKDD